MICFYFLALLKGILSADFDEDSIEEFEYFGKFFEFEYLRSTARIS